MTVVDIQLSPAGGDWPRLRDAALGAEAAGYGALWVFDHLAGVSLEGTTMLECFTLLGALAESTSSIELGTSVVNVWNRQVGTLVTAAASVAALSGRRFHFGIGAGSSPTSRWATEHHAVDAHLEPALADRHARVAAVLDLCAAQWAHDRDERFATFPLPVPSPVRTVGVNSVALSRLAGRSADGVNVAWSHPRRDDFLDAATEAAGERDFLRIVYTTYDERLLDPDDRERVAMRERGVDRLILSVFDLDVLG